MAERDGLLGVDPRGDADLVHDVALGNLKRKLFGTGGRTHVGRYEVRGVLGVGGMGTVYRAHDPELDRAVAIKVIAATAVALREARALATLVHPNVLPIYDVGVAASNAAVSGMYIVTELVDGAPLGVWLEKKRRSAAEIRRVFGQAARGLAAAHAVGFVHRDFKPSNVLVGEDGRVRVCDFGLVASQGVVGEVSGTPGYIAPEQLHGDAIGPRADQYAFCVTLWTALYGSHPYFDDIGELDPTGRVLRAPPRRSDVPHALHVAIERGLAIDPAARWPSMQSLVDALEGTSGRRRGVVAAAALIVLAVTTGVALLPDDDDCAAEPRLAAIWGAPQRETLRVAIADIDSAYASESADHVVRSLDAFAEAWAQGHAETCGDTEAARARRHCYDRRLDALAATIDTLRSTEADTLHDSAEAAASLPTPASCDAPQRERWRPRDAAEQDRVRAIERELARVEAMLGARRARDAIAAADQAVAAARELPGSSHALEAMNLAAMARRDVGLHAEAAEAFEAAYFEALALPMEAEAREAAIGRVAVARLQRDIDAGRRWAQHARALLPEHSAREHSALDRQAGHLEVVAGDVHEGVAMLRRALELAIEAEGEDAPVVTSCRALLADGVRQLGHVDEAIGLDRRVLTSRIAMLGASHPRVAQAHAELAHSLLQAGDTVQAKAEIEHALAIAEPHGETLTTASMLSTLAAVQHLGGDSERARATWERALAIRLRWLDRDHPHVTSIERNLGVLASEEGRHDEAAERLGSALDAELRRFGPDDPSVANLRFHLALVHRARGEHDRAIEEMLESLRALEAARGPDHVDVARPLGKLAQWSSDHAEARRFAERAVAIVDRTESDPTLRASTYATLAEVLDRAEVVESR